MKLGSTTVMYVHRYHSNRSGRVYMDIALYERSGDSWSFRHTVLLPSQNEDDWDAFFVADPYVLHSQTGLAG